MSLQLAPVSCHRESNACFRGGRFRFFLLLLSLAALSSLKYHNVTPIRRGSRAASRQQQDRPRVAVLSVSGGGGGAAEEEEDRISRENHESYCSRWNYDCLLVNDDFIDGSIGTGYWQMIPATLNAFRGGKIGGKISGGKSVGYDYVMWIDSDAYFVDCARSLDHLIGQMEREGTTWLFSGDALVINSKQMMWKNTQRSLRILSDVRELYYPNFDAEMPLHENSAFAAYLAGARSPPDRDEILGAYNRADACFGGDKRMCLWLEQGNRRALGQLNMSEELLRSVSLVPQRAINSYGPRYRNGDFIFHCAGKPNMGQCLDDYLGDAANGGMPRSALSCDHSEGGNFSRSVTEHTLATVRVLGPIRLADGKAKPLLSAVPAAAHKGRAAQKLAIMLDPAGPFGAEKDNPGPGMDGIHRVQYDDGTVSAPVEKYTKLVNYGNVDNWYADVPDALWRKWTDVDPSTDESCLHFRVVNETGQVAGDFETCHSPGVLPATPHNLTMCFVTLLTPDADHHGLHAGHRHLLPNIAYHRRHGVDQFVVYVSMKNRDTVLDLLAGPLAEGLVTLVLLDPSMRVVGPYDVEIGGKIQNTQVWFENDCMNRFKGHSKLLRTIDYDEIMYANSWHNESGSDLEDLSLVDELADFLADNTSEYVYATGYDWELLVDGPSLLHARARTANRPGRFFKSVMKPDRVALTWVHTPVNCYGHVCAEGAKGNFEYAHFRIPRNQTSSSFDAPQLFVTDKMFSREAVAVDKEVCQWRPDACHLEPDTYKWVPRRR